MHGRHYYPLFLCGLSLALLIACAGKSLGQTSYPLVCRGGGSMQARMWPKGLAPSAGQCAWLDCGWRSGEPQTLNWNSSDIDRVTVVYGGDGRIRTFETQGDGRAPESFRYLLDAVRRSDLFYVHAYQASCRGGKCPFLSVTRVGP